MKNKMRFFANGTLTDLLFSGDFDLTFGDAAKKYGEPEFIIARNDIGPGPLWASAVHTNIEAVLPSKGIIFGYDAYYAPRRLRSKLNPDIRINKIQFFDPKLFEQLAEAGLILPYTNWEQTQMNLSPWKGYGEIGKDYPIAQP